MYIEISKSMPLTITCLDGDGDPDYKYDLLFLLRHQLGFELVDMLYPR
jgi:hypothetical protein